MLCFILSLFTYGATYRFNRHCPVCYLPVQVEYGLTLGVLGFLGDFDIIHLACFDAWGGNGGLQNFFSLEFSNNDFQKALEVKQPQVFNKL